MYFHNFAEMKLIAVNLFFTLNNIQLSKQQEQCLTESNEPCVLPFKYKGGGQREAILYKGCTNVTDPEGKFWCATKVDENGEYIYYSKNYGYCKQSCFLKNRGSGTLNLRKTSDENVCDGDFNECVPTDQCEEYQDNYSRLKQITNKKSFEFRELRKQLKDSVCNTAKRHVCCSCPCVKEEQCPYIGLLKENVKQNLQELRSLICNRAERKFYCCRSNNPEPEPAFSTLPQLESSSSCNKDDETCSYTYLPSAEKEQCGFPSNVPPSNIIGGRKTFPGKYPYTGLVGFKDNDEIRWQCGGTLINRWYVVTAAHCHTEDSPIYSVRLGEWRVQEDEKQDCNIQKTFCLPEVQDFIIDRENVFVHENYEKVVPFRNDIALIKLPRAAELNDGVQLVCLPINIPYTIRNLKVDNLRDGLTDKYATVVGWGYTSYDPYKGSNQGDFSRVGVAEEWQQQLQVPILTKENCTDKFKGRFTPDKTQICAGGELGKDSCKGDSGGPLYMKQVTYSGRPISDDFEPVYLMGIVSFGSKKCGTGTPGVYTRVLDMLPWIMEKMNIKV